MDFDAARERMVQRQIAARGVRDLRVLDAMRAVPRHLFVPGAHTADAYEDRALPIANGQTISQPYMVAVMTEALAPGEHHRVLEIGTGSGYQSAILARLSALVVSLERHPGLAAQAEKRLSELGVTNVEVHVRDGTEGFPQGAPFERILVTAGAPDVPASLLNQLGEGGRLVIPVGPAGCQQLTIVDRHGSEYNRREADACVFVPLIGRFGWPVPSS